MRRIRSAATSTPSNADDPGLECASACSNPLLSAPVGIRFTMIRMTYVLFLFITIVYMTGCTQTSYQDYPEHWPAIDQIDLNGCVQISGVYPAASMGDAKGCKHLKLLRWNDSIRDIDDFSCVFLPYAMLSWDSALPPTKSVTDQIIVEQGSGSITISYVDKSRNYMQRSLQRDEDYTCQGNSITLMPDGKDMAENGDSGHDPAHDSRSFYRGKDGSLIYEEHASHLRTSYLPPFIVNTLTREWARWPLLSESVSDTLMRIKSPFLEYAMEAAERGDMDAAYRLLEDYLGSDDKEFRALSLQFFTKYPQVKPEAFGTFSIQSLEETLAAHGERAKAIEQSRLEIYKTIATEEEYRQARENFEKVFPN